MKRVILVALLLFSVFALYSKDRDSLRLYPKYLLTWGYGKEFLGTGDLFVNRYEFDFAVNSKRFTYAYGFSYISLFTTSFVTDRDFYGNLVYLPDNIYWGVHNDLTVYYVPFGNFRRFRAKLGLGVSLFWYRLMYISRIIYMSDSSYIYIGSGWAVGRNEPRWYVYSYDWVKQWLLGYTMALQFDFNVTKWLVLGLEAKIQPYWKRDNIGTNLILKMGVNFSSLNLYRRSKAKAKNSL